MSCGKCSSERASLWLGGIGIAFLKDGQWNYFKVSSLYTIPRDRQYYYGINSRCRNRYIYNSKITTGSLCVRRLSHAYIYIYVTCSSSHTAHISGEVDMILFSILLWETKTFTKIFKWVFTIKRYHKQLIYIYMSIQNIIIYLISRIL